MSHFGYRGRKGRYFRSDAPEPEHRPACTRCWDTRKIDDPKGPVGAELPCSDCAQRGKKP